MIRRLCFALLVLLNCSTVSVAGDKRIRNIPYDPDQIVSIVGHTGIQSTIEFGADERIENVAVGDSSAWQVTPNRGANLLFVKPQTARSRSNMTVVTDHRTYMFDLRAGEKGATPLYVLRFSYRDQQVLAAPNNVQIPIVPPQAPQLTSTALVGTLNFDWKNKGNDKLVPARVFDDGSALYLSWRKDSPLPAVLTLSGDQKEAPLNYRMAGDYIVIDPVPANVVLRYANKYTLLWRQQAIAVPIPTPTPTPTPTRVSPVGTSPQAFQIASEVRTVPAAVQPAQSQTVGSAPKQTNSEARSQSVRLADVSALYKDELTDTNNGK